MNTSREAGRSPSIRGSRLSPCSIMGLFSKPKKSQMVGAMSMWETGVSISPLPKPRRIMGTWQISS